MDSLLNRWMITMLARGLTSRTITERTRVVRAFFKQTGATPNDVSHHEIIPWLAEHANASTRQSYYVHLQAFFVWMCRSELRESNPMTRIVAPKRPPSHPRPITAEHLRLVLSQRLWPSTRLKILLAAYAGLRVHEIAKIHARDYDPVTHTLTVAGKGGFVAQLPLHPMFLEEIPSTTAWWFPSPYAHRTHQDGRSISTVISQAFSRAGIQATAHQLRHFFATSLVESGVNALVVQQLMRHRTPASTAIYVRVSVQQEREALNRLTLPSGALF